MHIHHDDDLDLEAEHATLEAEKNIVQADAEGSPYDTFDAAVVPSQEDTAEREQVRTPASDAQETPETKPKKRTFKRWSKQWRKQQLGELWYIVRKEHPVIGMIAPLHEELAVMTRFQSLLCFYVEIQLA